MLSNRRRLMMSTTFTRGGETSAYIEEHYEKLISGIALTPAQASANCYFTEDELESLFGKGYRYLGLTANNSFCAVVSKRPILTHTNSWGLTLVYASDDWITCRGGGVWTGVSSSNPLTIDTQVWTIPPNTKNNFENFRAAIWGQNGQFLWPAQAASVGGVYTVPYATDEKLHKDFPNGEFYRMFNYIQSISYTNLPYYKLYSTPINQ